MTYNLTRLGACFNVLESNTREVKRDQANSRPVAEGTPFKIVFCAYCGRAETTTEVLQRKFYTGYSACCNENMVDINTVELRVTPRPIVLID